MPSTSLTAAPVPTATPSPSSTAAPEPSLATARRTRSELRRALLGLKDVPAGFEALPEADDDDDGRAFSTRSECAPLVRMLNARTTPGSTADASISFSGGQEGPWLKESLDALGSEDPARAAVRAFRTAVRECRTVSLKVTGAGTSTLKVRELSFGRIGDASFAARFSVGKGPLEGFELIHAAAQSKDVLVGTTSVGLQPGDAEQTAQDAVQKVDHQLRSGSSI